VYQSLVGVNINAEYQSGVIQYTPDLASNWTVSAGGTTFTFNLRQNVTFSDGNPFNAYQVWMEMYGYYYLSGNGTSWLESYPVFDMSNVTFGAATIASINQSGLIHPSQQALAIMSNSSWPIYAPNATQIVFRLKAPFAYFPGTLVAFEGLIFDTQYLLDHGGFGLPTSFNSYFNQNPIPGTGPYVVSQVAENAYVVFTQNPTYWGRNLTASEIASQPLFDPGHVKKVIVNYKSDDLARYTDVASGTAQISAVTSSDWNLVLSNAQKFDYLKVPSWAALITALSFNTQIYPTNITAVRQALVHAINYTEIAQKAFFGQISPLVGPEYPAWGQYYNLGNYTPYQYNLTLAKQYLNQSGITNFPTLDFDTLSGCPFCTTISEVVQADLAQIGINVNINVMSVSTQQAPYGSYSTEVQNANQIGQIALLGTGDWAPSTLTPADYWVTFVSNQSLFGNYAIYSNPTVQQAVNAFTSSSNVTYLQSQVRQAQKQVYNDAPYAWLGVNNLWDISGSLVWQKNVVTGFLVDPVWSGQNTGPLFNTVTFA